MNDDYIPLGPDEVIREGDEWSIAKVKNWSPVCVDMIGLTKEHDWLEGCQFRRPRIAENFEQCGVEGHAQSTQPSHGTLPVVKAAEVARPHAEQVSSPATVQTVAEKENMSEQKIRTVMTFTTACMDHAKQLSELPPEPSKTCPICLQTQLDVTLNKVAALSKWADELQTQLEAANKSGGPIDAQSMTLAELQEYLEKVKAVASDRTCVSFKNLCWGASSLWHQTHHANFDKIDKRPEELSRYVLDVTGCVRDDFPAQVLDLLTSLRQRAEEAEKTLGDLQRGIAEKWTVDGLSLVQSNLKLVKERDQLRATLAKAEFGADDDSPVGSCNCLTKTPDIQYHKKGCKYRLIAERDALKERVTRLEEALASAKQVYVNEGMAIRCIAYIEAKSALDGGKGGE